MPALGDVFPELLDALTRHYGRPSGSAMPFDPIEVLLRIPLERMLDAKRVEAAVVVLRNDGFLDPQVLAEANPSELADAIRNAGLNIPDKALLPLRKLGRWLAELHQGDIEGLIGEDSDVSTSQLREELLDLNGIGPPTADAILLHGLGRPVVPLDRATYRILARHGWIEGTADYDEAKDALESRADGDPSTLKALADWFERIGADFCRATVPKCDKCPLRPFLPESGPVDPNA